MRVSPRMALLALAVAPPFMPVPDARAQGSAGASAGPPTLLIAAPAAVGVPPPPGTAQTAAEIAALRDARAARGPDVAQRLRRWEAGGPVYLWNQAAVAALIARGQGNAPASRALALLHAALHDAALATAAARAAHPRPPPAAQDETLAVAGVRLSASSYPSETAAMAAAAVAIMGMVLPAEAPRFAALAEEGARLRREAGLEFPSDAAAGQAIGQAVADRALARARDDGASRPWSGTIPTGPGRWVGTQPAAPGLAHWRAWVLPANDALRPPPPPAFDSAEAAAALAEVRSYRRTPAAVEGAIYWHAFGGTRNYELWYAELGRRVLEDGLAQDTPRVAAAYAALALAYADSHIACWDAKYAYWYIRPSQLDPAITTVVPLPSHPSYPSAHSCLSSAATSVLAALFPGEAARLQALTQQSSESRIAAGLHYRFDATAGEEIGRRAAALVLARLAPAPR